MTEVRSKYETRRPAALRDGCHLLEPTSDRGAYIPGQIPAIGGHQPGRCLGI